MSWITVIWSTALGTCLMMMLVHLLVWGRERRSWGNLFFSLTVLSVIGLVALEMVSMHTESPEVFGTTFRWAHFFYGVGVWASLGFVQFYFGTGRLWLLALALGLRLCAVVANFTTGQNLHVAVIHSLQKINFLGEQVSILGEWTANPWVRLGQLAALFQIGYVMDASFRLWRKGSPESRRRALTVGVSLSFFMIFAAAQSALVARGTLRMPFLVSLPFLGMVLAMGYELSRDVLRAAQLARELGEEERRLDLAAQAGGMGMWRWDVANDQVWMNEKGRSLFGFAPQDKPNAERFRGRIHSKDREAVRAVAAKALPVGADYETEYRVVLPDGAIRWLHSRGRVELGADGKPWRVHGVSFDVTERKLSEEALLESEVRFRTVADAAPVMIWMSGTDKLCNFFNKPWLDFTGRTIGQETGNGWVEGVHPGDLDRCLQTYTEAFDTREPFVMQYRLRRHDGEYRWISDTGIPRYDSQKNFTGYIGSCMDITESMQREQTLREFEERVTLAAQAAHLGVWELNTATNEVWMSDSARALFEFDSETRLDHAALQNRIHPDDRAARDSAVKESIERQGEYEIEYRVLLRDGTLRWIGGRGRCVTKNGKAYRLIGVSIDITERKRTQDLFRLAMEASPSGIILVDDRGLIVLVNSHVEELFGYPREGLMGKPIEILLPERFRGRHPGYRREFLAAPTTRAMGVGRELFGLRKDGSEFPVEVGLNPIHTADRFLVLATVLDISARKLAEAEAVHHREELGHLGRVAVMGELAASIAHELNQPLWGIISNASAGQRFIKQGKIDLAELSDLLGDIEAAGHRASDVIRGIRTMVKKGHATQEEVNLNDVVTDVMHMVKPGAMLHSCQLETLLEPNLPLVKANPIQLQQVLINLVINAFDAVRDVPPSRRKIVIDTRRINDGEVRTTVRDYGVGIQQVARDRLFEQFFTTKAKGLGLGLAIVRSIIQAHAGKIVADNAEGGGARFYFTLPVSVAAS